MKNFRVAFAAVFYAGSLFAAPEPACLFGDHMVLQRGKSVPVWGTAAAGEVVTVKFGGASVTVETAADGKWRVELPAMEASKEPRELVIGSKDGEKRYADVVVGDVWLCSGQSNMQFEMWPKPAVETHAGRELNGYYDLRLTDEPLVRGVTVTCKWSADPIGRERFPWHAFRPENAAALSTFSAAAWHFAVTIHRATGVPLGVIESCWGGTNIEPWISPSGYAMSEHFKENAVKAVRTGNDAQGRPIASQYCPRSIWNAMISPLVPYALKGAIWYQGEANRNNWNQYYELLDALRGGWAKDFGCGDDMPFYICQIAPFDYSCWSRNALPGADGYEAADQGSSRIREEMARWGIERAPSGGCVNLSDVGEVDCIHPGDKRAVGIRLAAMALNRLYGFKELKCDAPVFKEAKLSEDGTKVVLSFDNVEGWCKKGEYVPRFELAGADGVFKPVACELKAKVRTITLAVPEGMTPAEVAYLRKECVHSFIKNEAGLPLGPFRGAISK